MFGTNITQCSAAGRSSATACRMVPKSLSSIISPSVLVPVPSPMPIERQISTRRTNLASELMCRSVR